MKKIILIPIFILFICLFTISSVGVSVSPARFSIVQKDDYSTGNFTRVITVTNTYQYNISVTAAMKHPDPQDYMQSGRTLIKNLSWIKIEPSIQIIPSGEKGKFYVNFSVPEEFHEECLSSRWESWAALKISAASEENSGSINEGYLIRIYMDTPVPPEEPVKERSNLGDTVVLINLIIIVVLIVYLIFRKK